MERSTITDKSEESLDDEAVPIFGTWRGIYSAVVLCALLVMGLIAVFSAWRY